MPNGLTREQLLRKIKDAPDRCLITGFYKCEYYTIGDNVVYLPNPAYDAFTLPEYIPEEKAFYWTRYDMDDDFREEHEFLCCLNDLEERANFEDIKKFYNITE